MKTTIKSISGTIGKLRPFSFASRTKRHIALLLAYNGAEYRGLARQPRYLNTVEERLIQAMVLSRLIPPEITTHQTAMTRAGRTDKGVSSVGNVLSVWLRSNQDADVKRGIVPFDDATTSMNDEQNLPSNTASSSVDKPELPYVLMLNQHLPSTIRVLAYSCVPPIFSARKDAISRTYEYTLPSHGINLVRLEAASRRFIGTHDFSYFTEWAKDSRSYIRTMSSISFRKEQYGSTGMIVVTITAPSFVWHQIRAMMTVLVRVAQGLEHEDVITKMLMKEGCKPGFRPLFGLAAPMPLVLTNVEYPPGLLNWTSRHGGAGKRGVAQDWFRAVCEAKLWGDVSAHCTDVDDAVMWHDDVIAKASRAGGLGTYAKIYERPVRPWGMA
ncbi:hypothetical protein SeMB42_g05389 [Synchytrium endobioticum]|uniref:tRNA pseudouridine synthase n=1 Tax=Synchytrium endobioticum TaxID=286115 RepID=A0A507CRS2_9FUNG|nr:hypothetical protein SeMB42_g05389 [Synchytrium endobioticum]TPX44225.1 hypothetical protein SeLEV6574_g04624 [Synchytrium endobioticum]